MGAKERLVRHFNQTVALRQRVVTIIESQPCMSSDASRRLPAPPNAFCKLMASIAVAFITPIYRVFDASPGRQLSADVHHVNVSLYRAATSPRCRRGAIHRVNVYRAAPFTRVTIVSK